MLETEDRPTGNEPAPRRHRSRGRWLLAAAAVAVVAAVGALLAADGDEKIDTVTPTPTATPGPRDVSHEDDIIEPGTYFVDPDEDPSTPLRVTYQVAAEGWSAWLGAAKLRTAGHTMLSIITVDNLTRHACDDHQPADPAIGPTVDDLATGLSSLPPFVVSAPVTDVTIQGYRGKHLELTVPELQHSRDNFTDCDDGKLMTWFSKLTDGAFYGYNAEPGRTEQFWILDVEGTRLVIETNQAPDALPQDVAELQAIFDSIRIEP
jgi:hypothetical protein